MQLTLQLVRNANVLITKKIKHRHDYHTSWTYKLVEAQSFHRVYVQNKTVNAIIRQAAPTQGDLRSPMRANFQNVPNKLQRMHIKLNIIQQICIHLYCSPRLIAINDAREERAQICAGAYQQENHRQQALKVEECTL